MAQSVSLEEPLRPLCNMDSTAHSDRVAFPWDRHAERQATQSWHDPFTKLWQKKKRSHLERVKKYTWLDWAQTFLPCLAWMRVYKRSFLLGDIVAGISVGFMIVAQGLSYASLARLPSVYGLYGAFLPCMAYALVGTSKQLAVGPVAVTSLLIATSMRNILPCSQDISNPNDPGDDLIECQELYNHKVIQIAFIVACIYTGVGVVRLGWVTNFLSHAVISGFTSGASVIIGLSQLKYILGYSIKPAHDRLHDILAEYIGNARNFKWQEFIMGATLVLVLLIMKELGKHVKKLSFLRTLGPITACVVGLLAVIVGKVDDTGVRTVGKIPSGLPPVTIHWWAPVEDFGEMIPVALVVMVVDLLESTSIARALARKNGYELNYNLEIIGLGLANFAGAAFSSYTTTGSFSRSAVNDQAGAQSPLSQFVTAWVVGFVLLFLTPLFSNLPFNVLGAVILASIVALFDYEQAIYLWRVNKMDFLTWCASFLGTLFISVEIGLAIAIGLALLLAIYHTAFPHTAILGRVPGSTVYRNIKQYPNAQVVPGVLSFRIDSSLYFANVKTLQDRIRRVTKKMDMVSVKNGVPGVQFIILDMTPVSHLDAMGLHMIEDLVFETQKEGRLMILANPSVKILNQMEPVHLADLVGREHIFVSVHDATTFCLARLAEKGYCVTPVPLEKGLTYSTSESADGLPSSSEASSMGPKTGLMSK